MRFLAIDYGVKRVGIAISQNEMVLPLVTIHRTTRDIFFQDIATLLAEQKPDAVVVGFPLHNDGAECITTRQVRNFVESFKRRFDIPVYLEEELLSTFEAREELREQGLSEKKIKNVLDQVAAANILKTFLAKKLQ